VETQHKFALATILAPLSVPAVFLALAISNSASIEELIGPWGQTIFFVIAGVSYGATLLIGLPAVLILRRFERLTLLALCVAGALGGAVVGFVIHLGFNNHSLPNQPAHSEFGPALYFAIFGILVAAVFGLIAKVRLR
jgi:hypothetical protein